MVTIARHIGETLLVLFMVVLTICAAGGLLMMFLIWLMVQSNPPGGSLKIKRRIKDQGLVPNYYFNVSSYKGSTLLIDSELERSNNIVCVIAPDLIRSGRCWGLKQGDNIIIRDDIPVVFEHNGAWFEGTMRAPEA